MSVGTSLCALFPCAFGKPSEVSLRECMCVHGLRHKRNEGAKRHDSSYVLELPRLSARSSPFAVRGTSPATSSSMEPSAVSHFKLWA